MTSDRLLSGISGIRPAQLESGRADSSACVRPAAGAQRCEHRQRGARNGSNTMPFTDKLSVGRRPRRQPSLGGGGVR